MLGRKQRINNDQWLQTLNNIENIISKEQLDKLVRATVKDIKLKTAGKKASFAWSGGKDSLVLAKLPSAFLRPRIRTSRLFSL